MAILARKQEILAVNTLKKLIKKLITQKAISKKDWGEILLNNHILVKNNQK